MFAFLRPPHDAAASPVDAMQKPVSDLVQAERQLLLDAQQRGTAATLGAFVRLSGPGWLQSAITLGGGSLAGALFLGALGGVSMLWLQLIAIIMGVVMLSAISYVTLSTGERPFQAINNHINPVLGWGWLIATSLANMIWCMPQFGLCYTSLNKNLAPSVVGDSDGAKYGASLAILVVVSVVVAMNARRGWTAKLFDWLLKGLVGMIVICFFGVVCYLSMQGLLDWGAILAGFIPDFSQWNGPSGEVGRLIQSMPQASQEFWTEQVVSNQRARMIGAAATAVGINMTFLMPYSLLHRGWDKTFRGLARFDLSTGMAIPYILVTSCVVIASAHAFHARTDEQFLSTDPAVFQTSPTFAKTSGVLMARIDPALAGKKFDAASDADKAAYAAQMAALPESEKLVASSMVQRDAAQLSQTLAPLIGDDFARIVFGLGVFGMGFSTIIILMLINGFVFCEAMGRPDAKGPYFVGCLVAGVVGALWPAIWKGESQFWLAIVASNFGMMLLPIAYVTFFMMMNSSSLLGKEKPQGGAMIVWNVLMAVSVLGAIVAAGGALWEKVTDASSPKAALGGKFVLGMVVLYVVLIAVGFFLKPKAAAGGGAKG
ncbi:MAG: divalent metal cation transporter [Planctomycetales bacterium]|nr:divalent metal cation transporter [Planctomycetales bacterium]